MNVERHVGEHLKLFQDLVKGDGESVTAHRKFYDEYLSVMDVHGGVLSADRRAHIPEARSRAG